MSFIDVTDLSGGNASIRAPRAWLSVGAATIPCETAKVTRNSTRSADTFEATMALGISEQYGMSVSAWADYQGGDASILMSTKPGAGDQLPVVTGLIDKPKIIWHTMSVMVTGQDKSAQLADNRRSQKFQNQKSSDIVNTIAQTYGLSVAAIPTGDFAGKIYDQDTAHLVMNRSDFEILNDLAEREGYRWYVEGNTLYFEPKEEISGVYAVTWVPSTSEAYANATVLTLETWRDMRAAATQNVNLSSWHPRDAKVYSSTATSAGIGSDAVVTYHHNGKTQEQVENLAQARLDNLVRHDCNLHLSGPADLTVDPRMKLSLSGTGTIYDQSYDIDIVEIELMPFEDGGSLEMSITAKSSNGRGSDG